MIQLKEILDGKTIEDSEQRAERAFRISRDLLHASWVFSLGGLPKIGAILLGSSIPIIIEMKRQHGNINKRKKERNVVFHK